MGLFCCWSSGLWFGFFMVSHSSMRLESMLMTCSFRYASASRTSGVLLAGGTVWLSALYTSLRCLRRMASERSSL